MTASQVAAAFHAKRIGNGKWRAVCPVHGGKNSSPIGIRDGDRWVLVYCFGGCDTKVVLAKVGLSVSDLAHDKAISPEVRARTSIREKREGLERQLGLVILLGVLEKSKQAYWAAAERRIRSELLAVRCEIEPVKVYREWRGQQWRLMSQTQRDAHLEGVWRGLQNR